MGLAHLRAEEYVETGPLGAGLAALMSRKKAGDSGVLLANLQRRVAASGLDDARKFLLLDVIETYSGLSDDERARYETLISRKEYRTVLEEKLTWSDRMRAEGAVEAKRETLLRLLTAKFGPLRPETIAEVNAVTSASKLDTYVERFVAAESLEDVGLSS